MNGIMNFTNSEFGNIRGVEIGGEPWLVGKDVAEALGYSNTKDAIERHVDDYDKQILRSGNATLDNIPNRGLTIINESGLYSLILSSKLPSAKKFKHWVTSEVLPAIRKNGGYIAGQETMSDEELIAKALIVAQRTIDSKNKEIERMRPKEIFADAVTAAPTTVLIGELAKVLKGNGIEIGQNRLFIWMRNNGYLIKRKGTDFNMPTQHAMELGLFKIKESVVARADGSNLITKTVKVTGKGQVYFTNKFLKATV